MDLATLSITSLAKRGRYMLGAIAERATAVESSSKDKMCICKQLLHTMNLPQTHSAKLTCVSLTTKTVSWSRAPYVGACLRLKDASNLSHRHQIRTTEETYLMDTWKTRPLVFQT
jgi:hypothetical protein